MTGQEPQAPLVDAFGRRFEYLRLSVEDACNYRCLYCLPHGYKKTEKEPPLSVEEIGRLVRAFAGLGFWKVRLTGGEPTTRQDIVELARVVGATPGVRRVALSTNGYRLASLALQLREAGVRAVNVSVDSLRPERFAKLTGGGKLEDVLAGIEKCLVNDVETKVNVVLLDDLCEQELDEFFALCKSLPLSVRFIELMPTTDNVDFFTAHRATAQKLLARLSERGWQESARKPGDGPARRFDKPGHAGTIGVIAPYGPAFCENCNRLRVTSRGRLRLCLFAEGETSLRPLLQGADDAACVAAVQARLRELIGRKEVSHYLPDGKFGATPHFAAIGG